MTRQRIGIIGGGAKAAAVCAKAACLRELCDLPIEVTIFEQSRLGAAWSGYHGYTDGRQRLCTPAERDAGYPYSLSSFGPDVASAMQARFSWYAFAVSSDRLADWVDQGRPRPMHSEFSAYIEYCVQRSEPRIVYGTVNSLTIGGGRWDVGFTNRDTSLKQVESGFDGVIVTGTGPAASRIDKVADPRIYDGITFWRALDSVAAMARTAVEPIVIIGSGGTAAATAGWLAGLGIDTEIVILGNQAALYARSDSVFENRAFRDVGIWTSLGADDRRAFTDRLTRGAVWSNVLEALARAPNVEYRPGLASAVRHEPPGDPTGDLFVEFSTSGTPSIVRSQPASLVVDATGFDATWFAALLPGALRDEVLSDSARMRRDMASSLALPLTGGPPLHAPGLSQVVSPAFTSLMALGDLSDAILRPYVMEALS
jgi:mycobactin lysine-N-oxygenase